MLYYTGTKLRFFLLFDLSCGQVDLHVDLKLKGTSKVKENPILRSEIPKISNRGTPPREMSRARVTLKNGFLFFFSKVGNYGARTWLLSFL